MKKLKDILSNVCITFTVLALIFGIACKMNILEAIIYDEAIFTLFIIALATTLFVVIREIILPNIEIGKGIIDIIGCMAIVLFICAIKGWATLSSVYFGIIFVMVLMIYLSVWLLTWWQSKRDEKELNALLKRKDKKINKE